MGKHHKRKPRRNPAVTFAAGATLTAVAAVGVEVLAAGTAHADVDWGPLIRCESGGSPTAQNPSSTASGLFQFLDSSWRAYGGGKYAARAKDATVAQQYEIANHAYAMSGLNPWAASRGCWGGKVNVTKKPAPAPAPIVSAPPKHAEPIAAGSTYTVQPGDCLSEIAANAGLDDWHPFWDLNRATIGDNPDILYAGQTLKVPA
jgi:LysM repeat protein